MTSEHWFVADDDQLVHDVILQASVQHVLMRLLMVLATQATTERDKCPGSCLI